mgnify:CR=1 FL=1
MKRNDIDNLINVDPDKVQAPALKAALEMHRKELEEREATVALERLRRIEDIIQIRVQSVRELRARERKARENLEKVVKAKEQFLKDGNWEAFTKESQGF